VLGCTESLARAPGRAASKEEDSKEAASNEAASKEATSTKATSEEEPPKEAASEEATSEEEASKEATSKDPENQNHQYANVMNKFNDMFVCLQVGTTSKTYKSNVFARLRGCILRGCLRWEKIYTPVFLIYL
jgi:hypothetical protein